MIEDFIGVVLAGLVDDPVLLVDFSEVISYDGLSDDFADQFKERYLIAIDKRLEGDDTFEFDLRDHCNFKIGGIIDLE